MFIPLARFNLTTVKNYKQMKIKYYLMVFLAGIGLNSCDDDFLNRVPLDQISDPEFWNSTGDLELYLNTFYDTFDGWPPSGGGSAPTKDRGTDIALPAINVFGRDRHARPRRHRQPDAHAHGHALRLPPARLGPLPHRRPLDAVEPARAGPADHPRGLEARGGPGQYS